MGSSVKKAWLKQLWGCRGIDSSRRQIPGPEPRELKRLAGVNGLRDSGTTKGRRVPVT